MIFAIITIILVILLIIFYVSKFVIKKLKNKKETSKPKEKKPKKRLWFKKSNQLKNDNATELKGAYVATVDKFLFRKELKILVLVSRVLPTGYIAFPKIGVDTILEPVGRKDLFNMVANKYLDIVIFEEQSMKPKLAIDIFDGSIGDEQIEINSSEVVNALKVAGLPLISIKVKTEYTESEIKNPIYEALGIAVNDEDEKKNLKDYGEF